MVTCDVQTSYKNVQWSSTDPRGLNERSFKTLFQAKVNIWGYFKALLTPYGQSQNYPRLNSNSKFVKHQNLNYFNGKLQFKNESLL